MLSKYQERHSEETKMVLHNTQHSYSQFDTFLSPISSGPSYVCSWYSRPPPWIPAKCTLTIVGYGALSLTLLAGMTRPAISMGWMELWWVEHYGKVYVESGLKYFTDGERQMGDSSD